MNRQRGIAIELILYAVAGLAIMAALATLVYRVNHWCNASCVAQTERADKAEAAIKVAQERATAMTLLWDKERQGRERDAQQRDADRTARFSPILATARALPAPIARVVFPAAAAGVLDDAIRAGNATITRHAGQPSESAAADSADSPAIGGSGPDIGPEQQGVNVGAITQWGVLVAQQYTACVDQVVGWQSFYGALRAAQVNDQIH